MVDTGISGCSVSSYSGTDCGFNVQTGGAATTVYSEMASLYYDTLGNKGYCDSASNCPQPGWSGATPNAGPFSNLVPYFYWSGLEYAPDTSSAWDFDFKYGNQYANGKSNDFFAWAVLPGDPAAPVPEPGTLALLGLGLAGIGWTRRKAKR